MMAAGCFKTGIAPIIETRIITLLAEAAIKAVPHLRVGKIENLPLAVASAALVASPKKPPYRHFLL